MRFYFRAAAENLECYNPKEDFAFIKKLKSGQTFSFFDGNLYYDPKFR